MFCSKCGKTIRPDELICPNCQAPVGDNRFGGIPYTSTQFKIAPGQTTFEPLKDYTRTTYTGMNPEAQESGEIDSRTTYRPVYEGSSVPEDVRRDMRAAVREEAEETEDANGVKPVPEDEIPEPIRQFARDTLNEVDEDLRADGDVDMSQFRSRPIESKGRAGISRDVSDYIQKLEEGQSRKGAGRHRRAAEAVYGDEDATAPTYDDYDGEAPLDPDQSRIFDEIDDEEFEELRHAGRFNPRQLIKIVIALVLVAAIVVGGIFWLRYIRSNESSAPIVGVSETLYTQGIQEIKSHVESSYINELISMYTSDGILSVATRLEEDSGKLSALLPETPAVNDATFVQALTKIQENIGNAITMDAMAVGSTDTNAVSESEGRWQIVTNSITQLESATSAEELTAIINAETITVASQTPAPTAEPVKTYASLQKGDKNNAVLDLQVRLYNLGYLNDDRDGNFGGKTQTAVKLFQQTAGLDTTGIADNETQTLLFSENAPYAPGAATPNATLAPSPSPEATSDIIQPAEATGNDVLTNAA